MSTKTRYVTVLLIGALLSAGLFAQALESATATGVVTAQLQSQLAVKASASTVLSFPSNLNVSVAGCESSGQGDVGCVATVHGGSGQYNYWWMWDGPGHLYQTNSDYVSINQCLDGEGYLTVQVLDRGTDQVRRSAPYRVMCDCSPWSDACSIDIFWEEPCWPDLDFCP